MDKPAYTPGPWRLETKTHDYYSDLYGDSDVTVYRIMSGDEEIVSAVEAHEPDMQLMAAAADLLEACEAIFGFIAIDFPSGFDSEGNTESYRDAYKLLCAALEKAGVDIDDDANTYSITGEMP